MKGNYQITMVSCFLGYVVQAVVNNFAPLLFVTFQREYHIPLSKIALLVSINFGVQLLVDLLAAKSVDKIGVRRSILGAYVFAAAGLVSLAVLPEYMDPFGGILISVVLYAIGGGIIEVLISPIVESCPTENKERAMSLLHSFYCWGHVAVVLLSTLFFALAGVERWRVLALLWAVLPAVNWVLFLRAPIAPLVEPGQKGMGLRELFRSRLFWLLLAMMVCAGASEQAVSQWASAFAEQGLGISKTAGDLAGPMAFAALMGTARAVYGAYGGRLPLERFMVFSGLLCAVSYLLAGAAPWPAVNLAGCALCGFSVGIMWPGVFSKAAAALRRGGTAMFALLALAGDLGCSAGPALVGAASSLAGGGMKAGIAAGIVFPAALTACLLYCRHMEGKRGNLSRGGENTPEKS